VQGRDANSRLQRSIRAQRLRDALPSLAVSLRTRLEAWALAQGGGAPFLYDSADYAPTLAAILAECEEASGCAAAKAAARAAQRSGASIAAGAAAPHPGLATVAPPAASGIVSSRASLGGGSGTWAAAHTPPPLPPGALTPSGVGKRAGLAPLAMTPGGLKKSSTMQVRGTPPPLPRTPTMAAASAALFKTGGSSTRGGGAGVGLLIGSRSMQLTPTDVATANRSGTGAGARERPLVRPGSSSGGGRRLSAGGGSKPASSASLTASPARTPVPLVAESSAPALSMMGLAVLQARLMAGLASGGIDIRTTFVVLPWKQAVVSRFFVSC
jgi:hypothetical protein